MSVLFLTTLFLSLSQNFASARVPKVTAVTYIGQHFEVREHDAPIKYVFNGSTRVARITSNLSPNERVQRLRVSTGWNLCSLAVTAPNVHSQLSTLNSQLVVTAAYKWNPNSSGWDPVPPNETLPAGSVLWIHATTNATLRVTGEYSGPPSRLTAQTVGSFLPSAGLEVWSPGFSRYPHATFWSFDTPERQWNGQLPPPPVLRTHFPSNISPGQALYAQSSVPIELELPDPALSLRFYHQDHLGSSSGLTDAQGNLVEETANYPFGHPRHQHQPKGTREPYQITQKERDAETGLHYFEARLLASALARFTRIDPLAVKFFSDRLSNPQSANVYAYCANRPTVYSDPTGLAEGPEGVPGNKNPFAIELRKQSTLERLREGRAMILEAVKETASELKAKGKDLALRTGAKVKDVAVRAGPALADLSERAGTPLANASERIGKPLAELSEKIGNKLMGNASVVGVGVPLAGAVVSAVELPDAIQEGRFADATTHAAGFVSGGLIAAGEAVGSTALVAGGSTVGAVGLAFGAGYLVGDKVVNPIIDHFKPGSGALGEWALENVFNR